MGISWMFLLGAIVLFIYTGRSLPRPWFLFIPVGVGLTVLTILFVVYDSIPVKYQVNSAVFIIICSIFIRISGYTTISYSGGDHFRLMQMAKRTAESGSYPGAHGLYAAAKVFILEAVGFKYFTGVHIPTTNIIFIFCSALLPIMIGIVAWYLTSSSAVGFLSAIVATSFPLLLRTSALLEAEMLVLTIFVPVLYTLVSYDRTNHQLYLVLLLFLLSSIVLIHFLYALIIVFSVLVMFLVKHIMFKFGFGENPAMGGAVIGVSCVGLWTFSYIVWSSYAGISVGIVTSILYFDIGPLTELIYPSSGSGTIAASTGDRASASRTGNSVLESFLRPVVRYSSIFVPTALGAVGGVKSVFDQRHGNMIILLFIFVGLTFGIALGLGGSGPTYQLRMYYTIGILILIFASIGVKLMFRSCSDYNTGTIIVLFVLLIVYFTTAPISPFGNNVDPQFGGQSFATTKSSAESSTTVSNVFGSAYDISVDRKIDRRVGAYIPITSVGAQPARLMESSESCDGDIVYTDGTAVLCAE